MKWAAGEHTLKNLSTVIKERKLTRVIGPLYDRSMFRLVDLLSTLIETKVLMNFFVLLYFFHIIRKCGVTSWTERLINEAIPNLKLKTVRNDNINDEVKNWWTNLVALYRAVTLVVVVVFYSFINFNNNNQLISELSINYKYLLLSL